MHYLHEITFSLERLELLSTVDVKLKAGLAQG